MSDLHDIMMCNILCSFFTCVFCIFSGSALSNNSQASCSVL